MYFFLFQFRPLEQLMGVFPAASSKHVPAPWAKLMTDPVRLFMCNYRTNTCYFMRILHMYYMYHIKLCYLYVIQQSMIIDFYPEDFKIDLNGKKFAWQGVALLPFVDENRLFKALAPYYDSLTEAESE